MCSRLQCLINKINSLFHSFIHYTYFSESDDQASEYEAQNESREKKETSTDEQMESIIKVRKINKIS